MNVFVTLVPTYSTERSEQYAANESRTATLDLKGRRKGSVPFADLEDDKNLTNITATAGDPSGHGEVVIAIKKIQNSSWYFFTSI